MPNVTPSPPKSGQNGRVRVGGPAGILLPGQNWRFTEGGTKFSGSAFGSSGQEVGYGLRGCTGSIVIVAKGGLNIAAAQVGIRFGAYVQLELFEDHTDTISHQFTWVGIDSVERTGNVDGGYQYTVTWSSHGDYALDAPLPTGDTPPA
jgi:hypothetical protein